MARKAPQRQPRAGHGQLELHGWYSVDYVSQRFAVMNFRGSQGASEAPAMNAFLRVKKLDVAPCGDDSS